MSGMRRDSLRYRLIWIEDGGNRLPHPCFFCEEPVTQWGRLRDDGLIHHVDDDPTNNVHENLVVAHRSCHTSYHSSSRPRTLEQRQRVRHALVGVPHSTERRSNQSVANKRVWASKKNVRTPCPYCKKPYGHNWLTRHINQAHADEHALVRGRN